jgi:alginate O-acetyltransferase complex protein AlgJ
VQNNLFISSFKKLSLLVLPIVLWQFVELFVLPMDAFTFRAWETMSINEVFSIPGVFYPDQEMIKVEAGDLDRFRVPRKKVVWITDKYGFRNRPANPEPSKYDIVVIGDSHFAGSYISQENTLSEVLASKCNCSVYNFAKGLPGNIQGFFNSKRFKNAPPRNIVFEIRRGDIEALGLPELKTCESDTAFDNGLTMSCASPSFLQKSLAALPISWQIKADRLLKQPFLHFLKSRMAVYIRESANFVRNGKWNSDKDLVNIPDPIPKTNSLSRNEQIDIAFNKILSYKIAASVRGIHFVLVFMPSMNREFDSLVSRLEKANVSVVGFLPNKVHSWELEDIQRWFHREDYHWKESSIVETADLILEKVQPIPSTIKVAK